MMKMDNWFKALIVFFVIVLLFIFYQYTENGRYTYHKEIDTAGSDRYVVDTRTGIMYGEFTSAYIQSYFYKKNLITGEIWQKPLKFIEGLPEKSKPSPK